MKLHSKIILMGAAFCVTLLTVFLFCSFLPMLRGIVLPSAPASGMGRTAERVTQDETAEPTVKIPEELEIVGGVVYYCVQDDAYKDEFYGTDSLKQYACGPTSMAMVISTLSDTTVINPIEMCAWSVEHGYWKEGGGSFTALLTEGAKAFDIPCEQIPATADNIREKLGQGKLIIVAMGPSVFTNGSHFIVLRGIDENGDVLICDSYNRKFTNQPWDLYELMSLFRYGGMWVFG